MIFSFEGIKEEIKNRLSLLSDWRKILYFGVYERLVDIMAYIIDKFAYTTEIYFRESQWDKAELRESIIGQLGPLSYIAHRKKSAFGTLVLNASSNFSSGSVYTGESVPIYRWSEFTNENGDVNVFALEDSIYYKNTVGNHSITVKEGTPKEYLYTALGNINEAILIASDSVENDELDVFIVDSNKNILQTVTIIDDLYFAEDLTNYYCSIKNSDDYTNITINFGDNIKARALKAGELVLVKYAESKGSTGGTQSQDVITVIKTPLYDANNNSVSLYVTNEEAISDGSEIESITSIKKNAPRLFQTGYRCGNDEDWVAAIESSSYVKKAKTWTDEDLGLVYEESNMSKIYATAISTDGSSLTSAQQQDISLNIIKEKKSPTEILIWQPLQKLYLLFETTAKVINLSFPVIKTQIKTALINNFGILNTEFKNNVYESNYIAIIDDLDSVIKHETILYHLEKPMPLISTNHEILVSYTQSSTSVLEDQVYVVPESVKVWIKRKIASVWQEPYTCAEVISGQLIGVNGFTFSDTLINSGTNMISYTCNTIINNPAEYGVIDPGENDALGYELALAYKTKDGYGLETNSVRLPMFYHITDIDDYYVFCDLEYNR